MSAQIDLLRELSETPGAPGFEQPIRTLIIENIKDLVDEFYVDNIGNLVGVRKGSSSKSLLTTAHMDEIGFIVTFIDEDGFVHFHPLGGFDPKTLTAQRVVIHGKKDLIGVMGSKPIHVMTAEERVKVPKLSDYFIDLGLPYDEVVKWVEIGNPITRERNLIEMGRCVNGKSLDNRIAVFILIETLKLLKGKTLPCDFYAVFTVQEEVGIRGASVISHRINPDFGIVLDTTIAYDLPGAKPVEKITSLGKGAAIKVMDASAICDHRMVAYMKKIAIANNIPYQLEVLGAGGTDTAGVQRMGKNGSIAGAISIPTRHLHQVIEMVNMDDVENCIELLHQCVLNLESFDLKF